MSARELRLIVRDNGTGFEATDADLHADLGLIAMQERARQAGGRVEVRSGSGCGPEIHAAFPLRGS